MPQNSIFTSADVAFLRAAAAPRRPAGRPDPHPHIDPDGPAGEHLLRDRLAALTGDERLLEAVAAASPSLARDLRDIAAGAPVKAKALRRSALALTKYHLRMTGRATPFGLFAGVAPARIGTRPALRTGTTHRPVSRPDAAWLDAVLDQVRSDPAVLARATVVRNPLRTVRDGRLLLTERFDDTGARRLETSIRFTPLVRAVLQAAARPIGWTVLVDHLRRRFGAGKDELEAVLRQLVAVGALLTDLDPPPHCTDPLGHVLTVAAGDEHPLFDHLRRIRRALQDADAAAPADRPARTRAVAREMRELHGHPTQDVTQTDLRLDVDLTLPAEVAREAERAAEVLWRLTRPAGAPWLAGYHERFLERYGTDRAVPVTELLDDTTGLGLPPWHRTADPGPCDGLRELVLGERLLAAVRERRTEIVLDDALVDLLAPGAPEQRPPSAELCVEVLADGWDPLCAGEFRLVVGPSPGSALAGSTAARFAHLLPELDEDLTRLVRDGAPAGNARAAQVACRPRARRSGNVAAVPQRLPLRIPLGCGPAATPATDVPLDRLAVTATADRLHVVDVATGERIAPVSGSMLNPRSGHVPPVARFLLELGEQDTPQCRPWSWGALAASPYLPAVRHGRTVLAPARWLPSREMLDADLAPAEWRAHLAAWRERWDVPREVRLTAADNRIPIDLDDPLHVMVFRDELRRYPQLVVQEAPADGGWLRGPDGPHACEVVFQLLGRREPAPAVAAPAPVAHRPADLLHMPGGEWLYAKLYAGEAAQESILRSHLAALVDEDALAACGVDAWFHVRYADPDPHLRLRFHGKPDGLWSALLPRLHEWAGRLRQDGLLARCVLDSYDPEVERYGGPDVMAAAERVFHADSRAALAVAPLLARDRSDVLAAQSVLDLVLGFGPVDTALTWLAAAVPVEARRAVPAAERAELAAALIGSEGSPVSALWTQRAGAVTAYATALDVAGCPPDRRHRITASVAHLHCNRLFGVDRAREHAVYALLHGGLALRAGRERYGR